MTHKPKRQRAGTWSVFERRFKPIAASDGSLLWSWHDLPKRLPEWQRHVWTVTECDGRLYAGPGIHHVNRVDHLLCEIPWTDEDERRPDYLYA